LSRKKVQSFSYTEHHIHIMHAFPIGTLL